jgi:hypothetical protein
LLLLGCFLVISLAVVEKSLSFGVLRVLNGSLMSREYILTQMQTVIGTSGRCDILLPAAESHSARARDGKEPSFAKGYRKVAGAHCRIVAHGRDLFIEPLEGTVEVNDEKLYRGGGAPDNGAPGVGRLLKFDDIVVCGTVRFLYKRE